MTSPPLTPTTSCPSDMRWLKSDPDTWQWDDMLRKQAERIAPDIALDAFLDHFRENAPDYGYSSPKRAFRNWLKREQAKQKSRFKTQRVMTYKQALQEMWNRGSGVKFDDIFERVDRDGKILWALKKR